MVPGNAFHFISELALDANLEKFIAENIAFHKNEAAFKALFIGELKCAGSTYEQFFFDFTLERCFFRQGDDYFLWKKENAPEKITPFFYYSSWRGTIINSAPMDKAVRATTGGRQDLMEVSGELASSAFLKDETLFRSFNNIGNKKRLEKATLEEVLAFSEMHHFSEKDDWQLVSTILKSNEKLACAFFEAKGLSVNLVKYRGVNLTVMAAQWNKLEFMRLMIKNGADLNVKTKVQGRSPLMMALLTQNIPMLELLLQQPSVDLNVRNAAGIPAIVFALRNDGCLQAFLRFKERVNIDIGSPDKQTALSYAQEMNDPVLVGRLLAAGADPNALTDGVPPLSIALCRGHACVDALLEKSGSVPYLESNDGAVPIVVAMERSSIEIVEKLLKRENAEKDKAKRMKMNKKIFYAALAIRQTNKINAALKLDIDFTSRDAF